MPTISPQLVKYPSTKPMISKILLAMDYPLDNPEILEYALDIADKFQAQLQIVHCLQPVSMPELGALVAYGGIDPTVVNLQERQFEDTLRDVSQWLQTLAQEAQDRQIAATADYKIGEPCQEICAIAKEWKADLIIVGRRGLQGIGEIIVGSVSNYVLQHAPCSVMVVQHPR